MKTINILKPGILLGFFLCFSALSAQYTYRLYRAGDPLMAIGSVSVFSTAYWMQKQVKPLTETSILALNKLDINGFDRIACTQWNKNIAHVSDGVAIGSGLIYLYYVIRPDTRSSAMNIGSVAFQSLMLSQALSNSFKLTLRNRPYMYNPDVDMAEKRKQDGRMSFFSAHTSTVSALCFSFAFAHQTYLDKNKSNTAIWVGAFTLPAVEGLLRVKAGKHFPSDVIVGYLTGLGTSYLMHRLHKVSK